ncbi:hypothetical protein H5410_015459 [Solanum commersonii]|uniref:Uncharacterized protein n=1 Tax=Solanum commersonii TaxID=4109 RepID=A0A9J5ZU56_SOLCO|nr:hypothetical protein H5410_015459 [Solanum commersonii]
MDLGWIETLNLLTGCYAPNCKDFSKIIKDFELIDPLLLGGKYTWFRGNNKKCSLRIDKFLHFVEWDRGEWDFSKSYFKFENWWMEVVENRLHLGQQIEVREIKTEGVECFIWRNLKIKKADILYTFNKG